MSGLALKARRLHDRALQKRHAAYLGYPDLHVAVMAWIELGVIVILLALILAAGLADERGWSAFMLGGALGTIGQFYFDVRVLEGRAHERQKRGSKPCGRN